MYFPLQSWKDAYIQTKSKKTQMESPKGGPKLKPKPKSKAKRPEKN
jgi:hypothetical protein